MSMDGQGDTLLDNANAAPDPNADADFEAAFNTARGNTHAEGSTNEAAVSTGTAAAEDKPAEPDPAAAAAEAQAKADADAAAAAKQAEEEANAPVQITKAQLEQMTAQLARLPDLEQQLQQASASSQKAFGRLGSLQQAIDAMKNQSAKAGQGFNLTGKQLTRLEAEYPDLASMLKDDLADVFGASDPAPDAGAQAAAEAQAQAAAQVNPLDLPEVQQVLQQKEMAIVDALHPDWRSLKSSPEFTEWRAGLNPEAQQVLANTWKSEDLNGAFSAFKDWKAQREAQTALAQAAAQAAATTSKQRDKRLQNGVPATTGTASGVNAIDDDAAFDAGFRGVRGR